jgi:hypothetical protein
MPPETPWPRPGPTSGAFSPDPLRLLPFELRYLARTTTGTSPHRSGPDRWVIDISTPTSDLLGPQRYIEIPYPEDRLWVNVDHVPLFIEHGWNTHP